jgi:uncharacterized peroxidase-related enzyme
MAFIELISDDQGGEMTDLIEADRARAGFVPNYTRAFAHRPGVYRAWRALIRSITENMDARRSELAPVAAARRIRSSYCMLAHGKVLADRFFSSEEVGAIARDELAGLEPTDRAVMELADKVAADATSVTQADIDRLREHGLSDPEIVDVVLAAAVRCFYSKTLDALGVAPDAAYNDLDPELRDLLTVGRPIAAA